MKTEFSETAKVDVISELSKATGLAECTLFGITGADFSGFSLRSRRFQLPASRSYDKWPI
jgi:hypothetical protein